MRGLWLWLQSCGAEVAMKMLGWQDALLESWVGAARGYEFCGIKCRNRELNLGLHGHNVLS